MKHLGVYLIMKTLNDMKCYILGKPVPGIIKDGFPNNLDILTHPVHLFRCNNFVRINYTSMQII